MLSGGPATQGELKTVRRRRVHQVLGPAAALSGGLTPVLSVPPRYRVTCRRLAEGASRPITADRSI
jgi:hypothetical protein